MQRRVSVEIETFPIAGSFTISRGSKTEAEVVTCLIEEDGVRGRGECVPYPRYGETVEGVRAGIEGAAGAIVSGIGREALLSGMRPGAARNAVDCALWDLEAKLSGRRAHLDACAGPPVPIETAVTVSLGTPDEMAARALSLRAHPLIKVKVGTGDDGPRIRAVAAAAPESRIILDANEGWSEENVERHMALAAEMRIALIEQPLPAGRDAILGRIARPVPVCADESVHGEDGLETLAGRYDAINIKLDKTGGLTAALRLKARARALGFSVMVGCMVGSSLAMAPAVLLAQDADFADLDGPLLLVRDREPGLAYDGALVHPPEPALWG